MLEHRYSVSNLYSERFPTLIKHSFKSGPGLMISGCRPTTQTYQYSFGQLYALRKASVASNGYAITKTVLAILSSQDILGYRGSQAGKLRCREFTILTRCGGECVRRRPDDRW